MILEEYFFYFTLNEMGKLLGCEAPYLCVNHPNFQTQRHTHTDTARAVRAFLSKMYLYTKLGRVLRIIRNT